MTEMPVKERLQAIVDTILSKYTCNTYYEENTGILHAYVTKADEYSCLHLHTYFYIDPMDNVWYVVYGPRAKIHEYGCTINYAWREDDQEYSESHVADVQIAADSIELIISRYLGS